MENPAILPYAYGVPAVSGVIRARAEDFQVDEELGFEPSGAGEHVLLKVRKRNANTEFVARTLARYAGVAAKEVSYAGLKDRAAVTTQWFSVHLAGRPDPDWLPLESSEIRILCAARHHRKLRRGALCGNRFTIAIRNMAGDLATLEGRLQRVSAEGVPNYFGEQRFGRDNVARAVAMLEGNLPVRDRFQRGMYLSALRSELFNRVLATRVEAGNWCGGLDGDVMMLDGSHSFFVAEVLDEIITQRLRTHDIHPTGPLWGRGQLHSTLAARLWEESAIADVRVWGEALEHAGLTMDRRPLRVFAQDLTWIVQADVLTLAFSLPAGSYATAVLREVVNYSNG